MTVLIHDETDRRVL